MSWAPQRTVEGSWEPRPSEDDPDEKAVFARLRACRVECAKRRALENVGIATKDLGFVDEDEALS